MKAGGSNSDINSLTVHGDLELQATATLNVVGDVQISGTGTLTIDNTTLTVGGVLTNDGVLVSQGASPEINGIVHNNGTFTVSGITTITNPSGAVTNSGTITIAAAMTLFVTGDFTNEVGGVVNGDLNVTGTLINNGTLNPGASPGVDTVDGDFVQGDGGTLNVEVDETGEHDLLVVAGDADLDGTLNLSVAEQSSISQIEFLRVGGTLSGTFDTVSVNGVAVDYGLDLAGAAPTLIVGTSAGETINGTSGADIIAGLGGADTINGLGGNDLLFGGGGADNLFGDAGNDILVGGADNDNLTGGAGADTFVHTGAGDGLDTLLDFTAADDEVQLAGAASEYTYDPDSGALLHADGGYGVSFGGTSDAPHTLDFGGGEVSFSGGGELLSSGSAGLTGTGGGDLLVLTGSASGVTADGGLGGDRILDYTGNANSLIGGGGDDILQIRSDSFVLIDGGTGNDTLFFEDDVAFDVDLTAIPGTMTGIEEINMSGGQANALTLSVGDVLQSDTDELKITGDSADSVSTTDSWTDGGVVDGFHLYTSGGATLLVDETVDQTGIALTP
ncbi:MAG: hypothetical protein IID55_13860 [Proteobacteria bacterium]|nr:hypothetical protein [Pseudomonadota bacterium]